MFENTNFISFGACICPSAGIGVSKHLDPSSNLEIYILDHFEVQLTWGTCRA